MLVTNSLTHKLLEVQYINTDYKWKKPRVTFSCNSIINDCISLDSRYLCTQINSCLNTTSKQNYNNLIILYGESHNTIVETLVDTGTSASYISARAFRKIQESADLEMPFKFEPYFGKIKIADNSMIEPLGIVTVVLQVVDRLVNVPMIVLKNLSYDTIMGMDCMHKNGVVIDTEELSIHFKQKEESISNMITLAETVAIGAYSQMCVPVNFKQTFDAAQVVRNLPSFNQRFGAFIGQRPIQCDELKSNAMLNNLTSVEQIFKRHTAIGILKPLSDYTTLEETHTLYSLVNAENLDDSTKVQNEVELTDLETPQIDWNREELTVEQGERVQKLIKDNKDLFASKNPGTTKLISHIIDTGNHKPVHNAPHRASPKERTIISDEVKTMLESKVIQPSRSPWSAPVVLVTKKDGTIRFCIDYRKLNLVTTRDVYQLPRIDESLAALTGNRWFTTLDFTSGYYQIPMHPDSKEKTAFITSEGLFEFNVMSFGLTNAPSCFQRFMDVVLAGFKVENSISLS